MKAGAGRLAVITGGEGDLARALAERFRAAAWRVEQPGRVAMDVADASSVAAWFAAREVPELLVCAAGVTRDGPLARMTEAEWDEVVAVNLSGAARCARAVVKGMCRRKSGHIVFISSHSALHPPVGQAAYAAAKAGLLGLAKSLARESGGFGVRVNAVLPGFLETRMTLGVPAGRRGEVLAEHVLGRFNGVAEVAGFVHFLHESLPHTSGQAFALDSRC